jgi:hypothetical protein
MTGAAFVCGTCAPAVEAELESERRAVAEAIHSPLVRAIYTELTYTLRDRHAPGHLIARLSLDEVLDEFADLAESRGLPLDQGPRPGWHLGALSAPPNPLFGFVSTIAELHLSYDPRRFAADNVAPASAWYPGIYWATGQKLGLIDSAPDGPVISPAALEPYLAE